MVENYIALSLETHLFFARIMKEHALFLEAGFPCKDHTWISKSDYFRKQFEKLLMEVIKISDGEINNPILKSAELVTEFTIPAERRTEQLSGIPINSDLSRIEANLCPTTCRESRRGLMPTVHAINERSIRLLNEFIDLKESILCEMENCTLFTFNYPLLIKHIIREAKLYRSTIDNLMANRNVSYKGLWGTEEFWNQIMMEHALFIRGLLDPTEEVLIETAASLNETLKYRDFKIAGTKGILCCNISSIIIPLLADHVLREANHYIRILQCAQRKDT